MTLTPGDSSCTEWSGNWYSAMATCAVCSHEWVAVYPECCDVIECSQCGHMTTAPHLLTGDDSDDAMPAEEWDA